MAPGFSNFDFLPPCMESLPSIFQLVLKQLEYVTSFGRNCYSLLGKCVLHSSPFGIETIHNWIMGATQLDHIPHMMRPGRWQQAFNVIWVLLYASNGFLLKKALKTILLDSRLFAH